MAAAVRVSIRAREICSQRDAERVMFGPGGSAAGPKPGRVSFWQKLASRNLAGRRSMITERIEVSASLPTVPLTAPTSDATHTFRYQTDQTESTTLVRLSKPTVISGHCVQATVA